MKLGKRDQVAQAIMDYIHSKDADYGFQLPTVMVMSDMFTVSAETVRQAVEILKADGLLEGRRGSGLFYRPQKKKIKRSAKIAIIFLNGLDYLEGTPSQHPFSSVCKNEWMQLNYN